MGLRCSLLGHDFGDPEVEETREERGDEVVVTVREIERCSRCDEMRVCAENKEVTAIGGTDGEPTATERRGDAADRAASGGQPSESSRSASETRRSAGGDTSAAEMDSTTATDATTADDAAAASEESTAHAAADPSDAESDPSTTTASGGDTPDSTVADDSESGATTDDAIILGDDDDDPNAGGTTLPGERASPEPESAGADDESDWSWQGESEGDDWPDSGQQATADTSESTDSTNWPDHDGEDEGYDATPNEGERAEGVEFMGTTPTRSDGQSTGESSSFGSQSRHDEADESDGIGITRDTDAERADVDDDVETEFYCPECGLVHPSGESSLRPGDICPECKKGYIAERPR